MRIGIGITTRHRPEVLEIGLRHFAHFVTPMSTIIVVDDSERGSDYAERNEAICRYYGVDYIQPREIQRGIAKAKNACLAWLANSFDHIFLFDDDCFPCAMDWATRWIDLHTDHLCYSMDLRPMTSDKACPQPTGNKQGQIVEFNAVLGCMMYLSKNCLKLVGYFDHRFGIYGYEHAQYTSRAFLSGLAPFRYSVPSFALETIYSLDMDLGWRKLSPPLAPEFSLAKFRTSISPSEAADHVKYAYLMDNPPLYIDLEQAAAFIEVEK